jgi:alpha/beta superfamily hydrolase
LVKRYVMDKFEERECVFIDNEGQKIFGVLHHPLASHKVPVVLTCHGFAGTKIGKYRIYVNLAEQLAKVGIATLRIDFRGSGESEGLFSDMTINSEVSDVLKSLDFLRHHHQIDMNRIGILGNSFGSVISVLAANRDHLIKSMVLLAPLFDNKQWKSQWEAINSKNADPNALKEMARMLDGHTPGQAFFKEFFQLDLEPHLLALKNVPLLHIHSENDQRVGVQQAEEYKRCRKDALASTKWVNLQKSDHDFSNSEERSMIIKEVVDWFSKTL